MRQKIDPKDGPAMASGVLSVLYARLGDRDTYDYFVKSYRPNSRPPLVFSLSQPTVIPISLQVPELCSPSYTVLGRGTNRHGVEIQQGTLPKQWKS
jgi:hypothetical protein